MCVTSNMIGYLLIILAKKSDKLVLDSFAYELCFQPTHFPSNTQIHSTRHWTRKKPDLTYTDLS